jgi:predicted NBD/HSP70 family sugar kinase
MRAANIRQVLLAAARGAGSKREIEAATGLSWGAVSECASLLAARRIIVPASVAAAKAGPGRKTAGLALHAGQGLIMGMEVAVDAIHSRVISLDGKEQGAGVYTLTGPLTGVNLRTAISRAFTRTLMENRLKPNSIAALALSLTGAVDAGNRSWRETAHIATIRNVSFKQLQENLPRTCTVYLEHDIKARARAILSLNKWDDRNYAFLQFTRGVGLAVHHEHGFYTGIRGLEGEIGHVPYPAGREGRRCNCGKLDCLEAYLSTQGIMRFAQKTATRARIKDFADIVMLSENEKEVIYSRYLLPLLEYTGVMVANLFDPHTLIMGGEAIAPWQERLQKDFLKNLQGRTNLGSPAGIRFYQDRPGLSAYGVALGKIETVIRQLANGLAGVADDNM